MKRPIIIYGLIVLAIALTLGVFVALIDEAEDARGQAREANRLSERSLALAERRQGEIDMLQNLCTQLQETLAGEQERFESCLAELGAAEMNDAGGDDANAKVKTQP